MVHKGKTSVIAILSDHCGHCQKQKPILAKLKKQGYDVKVENVDKGSKTARTLAKADKDLKGVPALVFVCDSKRIVGKIEGVTSEKDLKKMIADLDEGPCGG